MAAAEPPGAGALPQLVSSGLAPEAGGVGGLGQSGSGMPRGKPGRAGFPPVRRLPRIGAASAGPPPRPQRSGCPGGIGWEKKAKRSRGERLSLRGAGEVRGLRLEAGRGREEGSESRGCVRADPRRATLLSLLGPSCFLSRRFFFS